MPGIQTFLACAATLISRAVEASSQNTQQLAGVETGFFFFVQCTVHSACLQGVNFNSCCCVKVSGSSVRAGFLSPPPEPTSQILTPPATGSLSQRTHSRSEEAECEHWAPCLSCPSFFFFLFPPVRLHHYTVFRHPTYLFFPARKTARVIVREGN